MEYVHGGDIYTYEGMTDFSANINPLGPSRAVLKAAREAVSLIGHYPDSKCRKLRDALAEAQQIQQNHLIFGNGAAELIFTLVMAQRPRKAIILAPSFAEYEQALTAFGCNIVYYPLNEASEFRVTEAYLECLNEDIDLIFLCSPSNPVGNIIKKELLLRIAEKCRENQIRMVVDECFYEFTDCWKENTLQSYVDAYPMLFVLRAFTKMHAMPGIRLGYGISSDVEFLSKMEMVRQPWSVSVVAQAAGLAAVKEPERMKQTQDFIRREREWMIAQMARIGVKYYLPEANYIFLYSDYELYHALQKCNILIRDCSNYRGLKQGYYRVAVRTATENRKLICELEKIYLERK